MSCYFTRIFVHLQVIVTVCYFSVQKLIGWDPANIYLFKFNSRKTRKRYEICSKLTINTIESCSDVFRVRNHEPSSDVFFVYLKCESVGYWSIVVICQNQLTIFIHIRSPTIADYTVINYLLQALVFLAKIGIHGIISGSKNSKLIFLDYKLLTHHMKRYLTGLFDILTLHSIRFSSIPLINFI